MKPLYIASFLALAILLFVSTNQTEESAQENRFTENYSIAPAPVPSTISFAGEEVPLDRFGIKERIERELNVSTFWQSNTLLIIKRSKKYFEVIDPILERNGIPADFKYLAVAESGLQNVTSGAGAKGPWQFMESSGKSYGLEITSEVDERYHLERSTEAACLYLKEAHKRFGSWALAAASYNRGMAGIQRDIDKQMVFDFYDLHLNSETSRYLMRIIAYKAILENPSLYGFKLEEKDYYPIESIKEVLIEESIPNLAEYAIQIGTNYHVLKSLNPWIRGNALTVKNAPYTINAPKN